jgi:hypothetical protein
VEDRLCLSASCHRLALNIFAPYSLDIKRRYLDRCLQIQAPLHPFSQALCIKRSPHLHVVVKVDINVACWNLPAPFPTSKTTIRCIASSRPSDKTVGPKIKGCIVVAA